MKFCVYDKSVIYFDGTEVNVYCTFIEITKSVIERWLS